jgi:ribA/ribD-fused uncharacterized protein
MEKYLKTEVCFFNKVKEKWGELSNMSNAYGVRVGDIRIKNTEALYQASRFPDYPEIQMEILKGHSGMASKMTSKKYRKTHTREDWDEVAVDIMYYCLKLKTYQNYLFIKRILDEVGGREIVEKSHKDQNWGTVEQGEILVGNNILGKLWNNIRDNVDEMKQPPELALDNFKLNGKIITVDNVILAKDRKQVGELFVM